MELSLETLNMKRVQFRLLLTALHALAAGAISEEAAGLEPSRDDISFLPWHSTKHRSGDCCPRREISTVIVLLETTTSNKHPVALVALWVGLIRARVRSIDFPHLDLFHGLFVGNCGAE